MDIGLDSPHGLPKCLRRLLVRQLLHVPKHDRVPIPRRQSGDACRQLVDLGAPQSVFLGTRARVRLAAIQFDEPRAAEASER